MKYRLWPIWWVLSFFLVLQLGGQVRSLHSFFSPSILTERVAAYHAQTAATIRLDRRIVSLLLIFLVLTGYFALRMYYQRKARTARLDMMQQLALEQERLRIARDMHDDLGSGISALSLYAEIARRKAQNPEVAAELEKIGRTAAELAVRIQETIWMINSHNDTIHQLVEFIRTYATELLQDTGLAVDIELPNITVRDKISGDKRRAVFLACKEAFNNILKHADATTVSLEIQIEGHHLQIIIQDDGTGFDLTDAWNKNGYGLKNMQERMYEMGGSFDLNTDSKGTTISLMMPYP